ncbi:transposase [Streptomyces sp. V1I1]|nr:transposase [Streptomyces sp. V1I1]
MTRVQLTDAEWEFIGPYLPIGEYGPYPERLRQQFEGVIWRFRTGGQWREMPEEFGAWSTVHNRFRQWRDAGVFEALLESLIAEAAKRGEVDLSLVSIDSTTARAHHDAAGMHLGEDVLGALEKAAAEAEKARSKGAVSKNKTDRRSRSIRAGGATTHPAPAKTPAEDRPPGRSRAGRPARFTWPPTASAARWRSC